MTRILLLFTELVVTEEKKEGKRQMTVPPDMPFDKPQLTELEDNAIKLTWSSASIPLGAKSTPIRWAPSGCISQEQDVVFWQFT